MHACTHAHTHAHTHALSQSHTRTHARTHNHTHLLPGFCSLPHTRTSPPPSHTQAEHELRKEIAHQLAEVDTQAAEAGTLATGQAVAGCCRRLPVPGTDTLTCHLTACLPTCVPPAYPPVFRCSLHEQCCNKFVSVLSPVCCCNSLRLLEHTHTHTYTHTHVGSLNPQAGLVLVAIDHQF